MAPHLVQSLCIYQKTQLSAQNPHGQRFLKSRSTQVIVAPSTVHLQQMASSRSLCTRSEAEGEFRSNSSPKPPSGISLKSPVHDATKITRLVVADHLDVVLGMEPRREMTLHLKVTKHAFNVPQDPLPVGPTWSQHLLHGLSSKHKHCWRIITPYSQSWTNSILIQRCPLRSTTQGPNHKYKHQWHLTF